MGQTNQEIVLLSILNSYYQFCLNDTITATDSSSTGIITKLPAANDLNIYRQYVWDADRLSVLQEYFPKGGYKLVYEKLNGEVSVEYIRGKARELGLKYSDSRWWTPEEDEIIIKYYPTMGCKVNCYLPNRSNSGIMNRAKKLNITYNKNK